LKKNNLTKENLKNELFTLPFEIEVKNNPAIYSSMNNLDFGLISLPLNNVFDANSIFIKKSSKNNLIFKNKQTNDCKVIDLYLTNSALTTLKITV
jgi:hypothetical protein